MPLPMSIVLSGKLNSFQKSMKEECENNESAGILEREDGRVVIPADSMPSLKGKYFGNERGELTTIEVLYLLERRGYKLLDSGEEMSFEELLLRYVKEDPRILVKYIAYRDWRDRGVFPFEMDSIPKDFSPGEHEPKFYPTEETHFPGIPESKCHFFPEMEMSIVFDRKVAETLYYQSWFGQLGKYKQEKAGENLSLDLIETLYLVGKEDFDLEVREAGTDRDLSCDDLMDFAIQRHPEIQDLLSVYSDWRDSGYIVKTGFKFGAHFRIYFPGAGTGRNRWVHSKHVLHVFPKSYQMLMSEWGRIIRLSQSVRKTFILGIPSLSEGDYDQEVKADLLLYHRTKDGVEEPTSHTPTFLCVAIPETLRMSGLKLANALREAESMGLQLLIAVVDRETDINYYVARKINLEGSHNNYYEIYWYRP